MEGSIVCLICIFSGLVSSHPPGHLKPLGSHLPPNEQIPVLSKFPSPTKFYEEYVKKGIPVLFKNILESVDMPVYYKWTDDYLAENYGNITVDVELGKKEDRKYGGLVRKNLSFFLEKYKNLDAYMVENLHLEMKKDMAIPSSLRCGGFQKFIHSIVMWFSSGGTKSHLHIDALDNINCLLDGKKDLFLIDKKYSHLVEADGWNKEGTFSDVDVDSVDMYKFPKFQNIPWYQVNLTKGDCFYIPYKWYHHVYSHPGRNFAVNVWFFHLWWFNVTDCIDADPELSSAIPYTKFPKPMEHEEIRQYIFMLFLENDVISRETFVEKLEKLGFNDDRDSLFDKIDKNYDGQLSLEEMYMFVDEIINTKLWKFLTEKYKQEFSDETNDGNTNTSESKHRKKVIEEILEKVIQKTSKKVTRENIGKSNTGNIEETLDEKTEKAIEKVVEKLGKETENNIEKIVQELSQKTENLDIESVNELFKKSENFLNVLESENSYEEDLNIFDSDSNKDDESRDYKDDETGNKGHTELDLCKSNR
ncbi:hypothetical protein KUTeg_002948 [Tegillarca granosa]|uniref:Uncharacterized protein n=1 Tax=Tegillarca granosa TaxID=220873 RepID=A0ABQ9FKN4_TEGGR|nr:hypothetical protein KUTeg_002948 [Tegillarca granosa]